MLLSHAFLTALALLASAMVGFLAGCRHGHDAGLRFARATVAETPDTDPRGDS